MTHVFSRFGMPLQLLTDRGPEFEVELFTELCKWMEIDEIRTTAYRAATNGMVERFHRTLNAILGKIISENQRDWCEKVPIATAAYRASVHEATGYTPNRLMLGRETRAPLDIVVGCPPEEQQLREHRSVCRRQATENERGVLYCPRTPATGCGTTEEKLRCSCQAGTVLGGRLGMVLLPTPVCPEVA